MTELAAAGERYDLVVCDPPAFAKSRKDAEAGLRAYNRMTRLAAPLVTPGGFLFVASCSHHAPLDAFTAQVAAALHRARRDSRVLFTGGAGPDHPVHPNLPESAYLKRSCSSSADATAAGRGSQPPTSAPPSRRRRP